MENIIISLIGAIFSGVLATIVTLFINHKAEIKRLFRGNGGLKTSTTPVFIPIRRHSTFG